MRKFLLGAAGAAILACAAFPAAEAQLYIWGGRNYCFYDGGWHGPGWYWCGYRWRRGFGWGGGYGWHGWHGGGFHGGGGGHGGGDHHH